MVVGGYDHLLVSERPYRSKVVTPASVFVGIGLVALGVLAASFGGGAGPVLIVVGVVVAIVGFVVRARRAREALDFEVQMMLHAADDPED